MSLLREYYLVPSRIRILFFLFVASLSMFFVEIVFYRNPMAFIFPWILIYLLPYALNLSLLISYIWKNGAYDSITKLNAGILISALDFFYFGHGLMVDNPIELVRLLSFSVTLYSVFGFLIPVTFAEIFLGAKKDTIIPIYFKLLLLVSALLYGIYSAFVYTYVNDYSILFSMVFSFFIVCIFLILYVFEFKRTKISTIILLSLRAPTMRNLKYLLIVLYLTIYFIFLGAPNIFYAVFVATIYLSFLYLLTLRVKLVRKIKPIELPGSKIILSFKQMILLFLAFLVSGIIGIFICTILSEIIELLIFAVAQVFQIVGYLLLVYIVFDTIRILFKIREK